MVIRDFLTYVLHITDDTVVQEFLNLAEVRHVNKEDLLFREGEEPTQLVFIWDGIFRGFFADFDGKDITDCFCWKFGEPLVPSLPLDAKANISMEALHDGQVLCFPIAPVVDLLERDISMVKLYNTLLLESLRNHVTIKKMLYQYTAEQKYEWFLREYPGLDGTISSKYIASFLGVTQVTLSRSRSKFREKER